MSDSTKQVRYVSEGKLKLRYMISLGFIAFLAVAGFAIIYYSLVQQSNDSNLISIASRQRVYIADLNDALKEMPQAGDTTNYDIIFGRIQSLLGMLQNYHDKLDIALGEVGSYTPIETAHVLLEKAEPDLQRVAEKVQLVETVFQQKTSQNKAQISREELTNLIQIHGAAYIQKLDELANDYATASEVRIAWIQEIEVWILAIMLLVLFLEGAFVFRPGLRQLYQMVAERGVAIKTLQREIRERKTKEEELQQKESDLRGLFDNVHDSIIIYNLADHSILDVNERACEVYGFSQEEFLQMRIESITKKPSLVQFCIRETVLKGSTTHFEMRQLRKDNRERLMDVNTALVNYQGEKAILSIHQDITEKRLAEIALRSSEEKYSNLFQFSNDCIIIYEISGRLLDCNEQVLSKFGILDAEVTSLNISSFYPREQHALLRSATTELIRKGYVRFEIDVINRSGVVFPAEVSANLFRMGTKKVVQAVFRDITERKEADRRQRALYSIAAITSFSDDMDEFYEAIHSVVGQLTYAENFYIALYDRASDTLDCPYFIDAFDSFPTPRIKTNGLTEYAIRGGKPLHLTRERMKKGVEEGKYNIFGETAVEWVCVPFVRANSGFGAIVVQSYSAEIRFSEKDMELLIFVGQHIASAIERKRSMQELSSEQERLKVTMHSITDGVITADKENVILFMNPAAEKITGVNRLRAVGCNILDVLKLSTLKKQEEMLDPAREVLRTGKVEEHAHIMLHQENDTPSIISLSVAPINDENSQISGTVIAFRDITDQQKMEEEIQKVLKLESIGILAGGIAHNFNNMLTAIIGNIALAKIDDQISANSIKRLEEAESASNRARDLTHQLLTFSKGGAPLKKPASITELVLETVEFTLVGSKISYSCDFPDDLWPVEADKGQISQVVNNIVINALQEMKGKGKMHVSCRNLSIRSEQDFPHHPMPLGDYLQISIADEGPGIPEDIRSKIFDPYFTTKEEGSGLGLATCYSIISKHDGYIRVDSVEGEGTMFTILLPAVPDKEAIVEESPEAMQTGEGRVLIMDDEESIRSLVGLMLNRLGYSVETAVDGGEAFEIYKEALEKDERFDAVIMDLTIPGGIGGKDAILMLKEIDPDVNAIVSSGYSNDPIMSNYKAFGFTACVAKPFNLHDIGSALRNSV